MTIPMIGYERLLTNTIIYSFLVDEFLTKQEHSLKWSRYQFRDNFILSLFIRRHLVGSFENIHRLVNTHWQFELVSHRNSK